ncbi:MAG: hypothetical protein BJ554DRAFT_6530, partial [Olpidium bornovanus]
PPPPPLPPPAPPPPPPPPPPLPARARASSPAPLGFSPPVRPAPRAIQPRPRASRSRRPPRKLTNSEMNFPRAARLAGALGAAAVVLVVLSGRDAALAAPGGGSCPPLPAPLDWSEVTELAEYEGPIVAVSERAIMEAAAGAPNADEIFLDVTGCPICTVVMSADMASDVPFFLALGELTSLGQHPGALAYLECDRAPA